MQKFKKQSLYILFVILFLTAAGCASSSNVSYQKDNEEKRTDLWLNTDTVKAGKFDTGKMWTFEHAPLDYFREEYNFSPTQQWLDDVRMSALRFATYCSASFVSEDGLVMTNNHCARESVTEVSKEGENLQENGFFAATLEEERQVPGLFVEQLTLIQDVTSEVQKAVDNVPDQEKSKTEKQKMVEIEKREGASTGLRIQVVRLYNGGKYSLYGYKRYDDVRLVFTPETQLGYFGGDPDNFTYPRYNLDCTFFRVYDENGNPLKTRNFLKWSEKGALEGEPVFVVGNPGTTNRLATVAQLEYMRDIQYPRTLDMIQGLIDTYTELIKGDPEDKEELTNQLYSFTNSQKAYGGMLDGLRDPILMAKKRDFERTFKSRIQAKPELKEKYGNLWDQIEGTRNQLRGFTNELFAISRNPLTTPQHLNIAEDLVNLAGELKQPEDQRQEEFRGEELENTIAQIYPEEMDMEMQNLMLLAFVKRLNTYLGPDYPLVKEVTGGRKGMDAVNYLLNNSELTSREKVIALAKKGPDAILNSKDPFIRFIMGSEDRRQELQKESAKIVQTENVYSQNLGRALYEVYGTSIPPDATFTLRISDGVVKGFPYNGTIAPPVTTFYGLYDRFYSFKQEFPWSLPERWKNPPAEFNLETPFNFVSTNDIIGGNSGSPVINIKGEVVGLAFDGNIQSLPGNFIFTTEENRTVSVHSEGMVEVIKDMYKATRLSDELRNGRIK
jgi:hypothetical protein